MSHDPRRARRTHAHRQEGAAGLDLPPTTARSWTHSYWKNCWNRPDPALDTSPDVLCFETGHYGLSIDVADLTKACYSAFDDDNDAVSYAGALKKENRARMDDGLAEGGLILEVQVGGKTYRAATAKPRNPKNPHLCHGRLWEAGRIAQHYQLMGIALKERGEDDGGGGGGGESATLECEASVWIAAWPEEFAISLEIEPPAETTWEGGASVRLEFGAWTARKAFPGDWPSGRTEKVTLSCVPAGLQSGRSLEDGVKFVVKNAVTGLGAGKPPQLFPVEYDESRACYVADIKDPLRNFPIGYTDIRDHDNFGVDIANGTDEASYVPVLFSVVSAANITGLVPTLWAFRRKDDGDGDGDGEDEDDANDAELVPTAIPVQLSKNWHYRSMGNYVRAYALVPAKPGLNHYSFRIDYGFYGALPSASHANLSLVGYPKLLPHSVAGRWEQLAVGCFGETFCLDSEMSATDQAITDVRALTVRAGEDGTQWSWTNAGWGGDWLSVREDGKDGSTNKLTFGGMKVAYLSHGPCLTDVRFGGFYGGARQVDLSATVRTVRTNDYARTFHTLRYDFNATVPFRNVPNTDGSCLFRVGGRAGWEKLVVPRIVLGNEDGLIEELEPPPSLQRGEYLVERRPLAGSGPWWVGFPGSFFDKKMKMGTAWRALIIRSFESNVGGEVCTTPSISLYARFKYDASSFYFDAVLTPPASVDEFNDGDYVAMDLEWITLPHNAENYYGDNQAFKRHLQINSNSWKTIHREATRNLAGVEVTGGEVTNKYPLIIRATGPEISVTIHGGVGAVPIRFDGLHSRDYRLFDSSGGTGRLFEAGYDPKTFTFSICYSIPLDDIIKSTWILKRT